MGDTVHYPTPDGGQVSGYLAQAAGSTRNVVVIQEWWGLNSQIRGVCDRFVAVGFNALAPDLYQGRVTEDPDEANHMMGGLDWVGATEQDIRGAVQHLKANWGVGAVIGGARRLRAVEYQVRRHGAQRSRTTGMQSISGNVAYSEIRPGHALTAHGGLIMATSTVPARWQYWIGGLFALGFLAGLSGVVFAPSQQSTFLTVLVILAGGLLLAATAQRLSGFSIGLEGVEANCTNCSRACRPPVCLSRMWCPSLPPCSRSRSMSAIPCRR